MIPNTGFTLGFTMAHENKRRSRCPHKKTLQRRPPDSTLRGHLTELDAFPSPNWARAIRRTKQRSGIFSAVPFISLTDIELALTAGPLSY
jgi:hypothetical protein